MGLNTYKSEEVYQKNLQIFQTLTNVLPVAVYTTDNLGTITYYNKQAENLWGRSPRINDPHELKYCGSYKIFNEEGQPISHDHCPMAMALKTKKSIKNKEIKILRPDNSHASALVHIDPIYNGNKEMVGAINVLFDVSERKKIEQDVYHLASIVESSDDGIISKTLEGEITSWNKGAERIFGYKKEEILGKNILTLIPEERSWEENDILSQIRNRKIINSFETVRKRKDGKFIDVSLTISPITNSSGKIIGISKIARDISNKVLIEKKIKNYNTRLKKLNRYKDEFVSLASHELKTPLTVIKAHLELLQELITDKNKPFIEKTLDHADKLDDLINKMLDVSRMQKKEMELTTSSFLVDELMNECIEDIKIISPNLKLNYYNEDTSLKIKADRVRIGQVVINLLTNAVKYSSGKREVSLNVLKKDFGVEVEIVDKGMGIPADHLNKIFNRFYRMEGISQHISGLGIGLYISFEIIKKHQGEIWVKESIPGKGSVFCFYLPQNQLD